MSVSRFRHTQTTISRPECHFLGVTSSQALWTGSNMIACNELYVAVPWCHLGSTAVFTHGSPGRVGPNPPVLLGQEGPVIEVQFNPFDPTKLFTASEDGSIMGWNVPDGGLKENCAEPALHIKAHEKKCGTVTFHPSASGVMASAGLDKTVKVWDIENNTAKTVISHFADYPMDISWNLDGSAICAVSRDKMLCVVDPRDSTVVSSGVCHDSLRALRCVWAKRKDQIITFGWDSVQRRQMKVWDTRKLSRPLSTTVVDQSSAAMLPMYDEDLSLLHVGNKGEGAVRTYELIDGSLVFSYEYLSTESVKGLCQLPKTALNVKECEIGCVYQLTQQSLYTIHMNLPRKQASTEFQKDAYPPTFSSKPAISAEEFFDKKVDAAPRECDLQFLFDGTRIAETSPNTDKKKNLINDVKALKKPPKVEAGQPNAYADPAANAVLPRTEESAKKEITKTTRAFTDLLEKLTVARKEASELRQQLKAKEDEMAQTLGEIEKLLSSS